MWWVGVCWCCCKGCWLGFWFESLGVCGCGMWDVWWSFFVGGCRRLDLICCFWGFWLGVSRLWRGVWSWCVGWGWGSVWKSVGLWFIDCGWGWRCGWSCWMLGREWFCGLCCVWSRCVGCGVVRRGRRGCWWWWSSFRMRGGSCSGWRRRGWRWGW